ncbi:unnamed protein product [Staurois parvus]|uniref:Nuclear protein MDM1 n=1 Tax=Staurois parvus TaxID=386267 RepID=A0ABN9BCV9_9NEOB|nr:unnamed protein product [Staurois parvus]
MDGASRMSPVSTIESSHTGSNDAVPPKFPSEVLGSTTEKTSDTSIPHHKDGIYSKDHSPKIAWQDNAAERRRTLVTGSFHDDNKASYCSLQHTVSSPEKASRDLPREKRDLRSAHEDEEFFPLNPEVDDAPEQHASMGSLKKMDYRGRGSDITDYPRRRGKQEQARGTPLHSPNASWDSKFGMREKHVRYEDRGFSNDHPTNPTNSFQRSESTLSQSAISNQSLDDLWARYTDRRKSHLSESSSKLEASLVERLDRLARLLQNPKPYSATKDEKDGDHALKFNKKVHEKGRETKKEEREKWYLKKFGVDTLLVNGTSENQDGSISRLSETASSEKVLSGGLLYSDFSSEIRSGVTEESPVGSEAATGSASTCATDSTISTIDTVRLINAFGPERVRPSSKLSRLYNTIDLQKKRSEGTSKKASRLSASGGKLKDRDERSP